eukprot:gene8826-6209_t
MVDHFVPVGAPPPPRPAIIHLKRFLILFSSLPGSVLKLHQKQQTNNQPINQSITVISASFFSPFFLVFLSQLEGEERQRGAPVKKKKNNTKHIRTKPNSSHTLFFQSDVLLPIPSSFPWRPPPPIHTKPFVSAAPVSFKRQVIQQQNHHHHNKSTLNYTAWNSLAVSTPLFLSSVYLLPHVCPTLYFPPPPHTHIRLLLFPVSFFYFASSSIQQRESKHQRVILIALGSLFFIDVIHTQTKANPLHNREQQTGRVIHPFPFCMLDMEMLRRTTLPPSLIFSRACSTLSTRCGESCPIPSRHNYGTRWGSSHHPPLLLSPAQVLPAPLICPILRCSFAIAETHSTPQTCSSSSSSSWKPKSGAGCWLKPSPVLRKAHITSFNPWKSRPGGLHSRHSRPQMVHPHYFKHKYRRANPDDPTRLLPASHVLLKRCPLCQRTSFIPLAERDYFHTCCEGEGVMKLVTNMRTVMNRELTLRTALRQWDVENEQPWSKPHRPKPKGRSKLKK